MRTERHDFVPGTICNVKMCAVCDEERDHSQHFTDEEMAERESVLARRRALMPGYDEALKEWLS